MTQSPRVVFFGNERLVSGLVHSETPVLKGLIENGYNVVAIVANHTKANSRSSRDLEVAQIASDNNIPLFLPKRPTEIIDQLRELKADCAVLVAYGRILPQSIIDVFGPVGIINVHPSLLPRHRGPTPIESTILAGDRSAGVSIIQLTSGMDEGPIYGQVSFELTGHETKFDLQEALSSRGAELLLTLLPSILNQSLKPKSQSKDGVTYTTLISKDDGIINPLTDTAETIERKVRAYLNFPKTRLKYKDKDVIITSANVVDTPDPNSLCIACAQNSTLLVESVIAPSGKTMTGEAFLRGLR